MNRNELKLIKERWKSDKKITAKDVDALLAVADRMMTIQDTQALRTAGASPSQDIFNKLFGL